MGQSDDSTNDTRGGATSYLARRRGVTILTLLVVACAVLVLLVIEWREPGPSAEPLEVPSTSEPSAPSLRGKPLGAPPRPTKGDHERPVDRPKRSQVAVLGRVRRESKPVTGHTVVLRAPADGTVQVWGLPQLPRVASAVTDAQGEFRLAAPPGSYVLQVGDLSHAFHLRVSAPSVHPLDINLAAMGKIVVRVRSPTLEPMPRAVVGLRASDGRLRLVAATDGEGLAHFPVLPSGRYVAYAAPPVGQIDFAADGSAVELTAPDTEIVDMTLSAAALSARPQPRSMRIVLPGTSSFDGWQARAMYRGTTAWSAINGDARVQIMRGLDVRAPDGRRWKIRATEEEMAAGTLVLPDSEVLWRGLLLDRQTNKPLAGYTVFARATGSYRAWIGSRTDASGEFTVRAVKARHISLTFYDPKDVKLRGMSFEVAQAVTSSGSPIQVRIPLPGPDGVLEFPVRHMSGSVRQADGSPPPSSGKIESIKGGTISVSARFESQDGVLILSMPQHTAGLAASGQYAIDVYLAKGYGATIHTELNEAGRPGRTDSFAWIGFSTKHNFELD